MGGNNDGKMPWMSRLRTWMSSLRYVPESRRSLSAQYGVPEINLGEFEIDDEVIALIPKEVVEQHSCVPINRAGASLIVAMSDPSDLYAIDDLKFVTGCNIEVVSASEEAIREAIHRYYRGKDGE